MSTFLAAFISFLVAATLVADETSTLLERSIPLTLRDLASPEHWFDPDKLRQVMLAARPD